MFIKNNIYIFSDRALCFFWQAFVPVVNLIYCLFSIFKDIDFLHEPMDDSTSLSSLNSADFILIGKEQPRLKVAAGECSI